MKFLEISNNTTLSELSDRVGARNVSNLLSTNSLIRSYNIGSQYEELCNEVASTSPEVEWQRKSTVLNSLSSDSDAFEYAALLGNTSWKILSTLGSFPSMLKLPDILDLPDSVDILGNGIAVSKNIYQSVMKQIKEEPHEVNPATFNDYSSIKHSSILSNVTGSIAFGSNVFQGFNIPWGQISLYSSLADEAVDIPVYPEEVSDGVSATYTQMPDILYQYEPWQVYESSGPRQCSYDFHMHRDMWTGDHRDGKCNELIRFCEAQCYAKYQGAAVDTSIVTLYVAGKGLITGVMNDCKTTWTGPIGLDGWYLECTLSITITEVSKQALNYNKILSKSLIN